jgi:hypothetical protein
MSAEMKSHARQSGKRSFLGLALAGLRSFLFSTRPDAPAPGQPACDGSSTLQAGKAARSGLRSLVSTRPAAPTPGHPPFAKSSLQGGKAALQRSKSLAMARFSEAGDSGCVLCAVEHEDAVRLCRLVGILPIGQKIFLPVLSQILDVRFKVVSSDLNFLIHQLRLPIKGKPADGVVLTEPLSLCKSCAQIGGQLRQTETFQTKFRAGPQGAGRVTAGASAIAAGGQGGLPASSPASG